MKFLAEDDAGLRLVVRDVSDELEELRKVEIEGGDRADLRDELRICQQVDDEVRWLDLREQRCDGQ